MSQNIQFVDTLSGINVGNGVVKLYFVTQDEQALQEEALDNVNNMNPAQTLVMPIPGFMYMVSVVKGLLDNPKMAEQIERYIDAGLLPGAVSEEEPQVSPNPSELNTQPA